MGLNESVFYIFIQIILNCILFINAFWKYFENDLLKFIKKHPAVKPAGCTAMAAVSFGTGKAATDQVFLTNSVRHTGQVMLIFPFPFGTRRILEQWGHL